jgi:hypothetical protein
VQGAAMGVHFAASDLTSAGATADVYLAFKIPP